MFEGAPNIPPVEDVDVVDGVLLAAAAFPPKEKVDLGAAAPALDAPKRFEPVLAPLPVLVEAPKRPPPVAVPAADPPPNKLAPDPAVAVMPDWPAPPADVALPEPNIPPPAAPVVPPPPNIPPPPVDPPPNILPPAAGAAPVFWAG